MSDGAAEGTAVPATEDAVTGPRERQQAAGPRVRLAGPGKTE